MALQIVVAHAVTFYSKTIPLTKPEGRPITLFEYKHTYTYTSSPFHFFTHHPRVFTHHHLIHDRDFLNMAISLVKVVTDAR